MRQKGFATIFGLCMILAVALCVKGIQESEMNHAYETADFQAEFELQNVADGGIYEAAELIRLGQKKLPANPSPYEYNRKYQRQLINKTINYFNADRQSKSIKLRVWGERLTGTYQQFQSYQKNYPTGRTAIDAPKSGYILLSVATVSNSRMTGEIYRRAFAYVLDDDATKIYFMSLPSGD